MIRIFKKLRKFRDLPKSVKWLLIKNYLIVLLVFVPLIGIVITMIYKTISGFLDRASGALTFMIALATSIYAYFTSELVKLEEVQLKPKLIPCFSLVGNKVRIITKNIGLGTALYVHFSISNKEGEKISPFAPEIGYIDYLSPNQCHEISLPATLLKNQIMIKKGTETFQEQEFEIYYCDFLGKSYIEEYPIPEKYLIDFDQLEIYWENNLKTISDTLEWRS